MAAPAKSVGRLASAAFRVGIVAGGGGSSLRRRAFAPWLFEARQQVFLTRSIGAAAD
jgi:hypothetical protein